MQFYNHTQCGILVDHEVYYLLDVTPCNLVVVYRNFEVMHSPCLQTARLNQVRKQAQAKKTYSI